MRAAALLCILAVLVLTFAPLAFGNAPFTVVCEAGRLSIHTAGVVYRITGISCQRVQDV